ncbi:Eco57I restriction-modification methylase domain-containing protein [Algoriphagus sp. H41]|uniref:site-specific DNA-methyltransferase (adenine-specific) n=1 Tax=Algoriphagus oliviformis TaxID=2811231 RepID=A0ABS3C129_9BACT|nr:TaqI-like C-terminal specificity domain-containing protein [Algoriphagus oliviformis]MBN7810808.1 Eco57I restriction-modification methylase domain-containing protein [Algoriphagus oliviformis]
MTEKFLKPKQALNPAFRKVKPNRSAIESFKANLIQLIDRINESESEEFHKNLVSDFLKKTYYDPSHFINTKGRNDLVIHTGDSAKSSVGVIVEAKKPSSKSEMISRESLNRKAFQELVLYYLRERIVLNNLEVKHLVVTNIHEWFIFDALTFDRLFAQNKALVKQFEDFDAGRLADIKTDFFYKNIAEPAIEKVKDQITFTYFDFREYDKALRNSDKADDTKLIALFKLLSPEHLLKLPFANDSNSLDKRFYAELLHIIGLTETKEGGKKLIERSSKGSRNSGSILEDAMIQLDTYDKISQLTKPSQYGGSAEERLFNVGLELSITWINRVLFLKLLEAQLIAYHKGDTSYSFLNKKKIHDWDDLNSLFFQVLAKRTEDRNEDVRAAFAQVPYLNSSLFEPTEMEQKTIMVNFLKNEKTIPVISSTVLKDGQGKKLTGELTTLEYLFRFLDAYDFASEGSEEIQEDNKTLINASVLGLIFEKINGYKDGSFFTPGFITMYMCRETIRKAVVQKFVEAGYRKPSKGSEPLEGSPLEFDDLYDLIEDRAEANQLVNSLKICDPAVGSGHFLVSALNEIIAVKNDLKILQDRKGKRLKEYQVEVVNDELIVKDEDGELFAYHPNNKESQRIQETLFHEKQTIIENCLFGVDINPNSVKICRLRLWIELLKSAYYKDANATKANSSPVCYEGSDEVRPEYKDLSGFGNLTGLRELETLPNIDINIKVGNSLVSRFALDSDLKSALKGTWKIEDYKVAVSTYRNAKSKDEKRAMEALIAQIKTNFRSEIAKNDPKIIRKAKLGGELYNLTSQTGLFEESAKEKKIRLAKVEKVSAELNKLDSQIEEIKANQIYENAFEWRFEFPEVLSDEGDFVGFDVMIGNPPYIRQEEFSALKPYLQGRFRTFAGTADLYVYFVELSMNLLKSCGNFVFIIPNKWMRAGYGKALRSYVKEFAIQELLDFGDLQVFEEATTYPLIIALGKSQPGANFHAVNLNTLDFPDGMENYLRQNQLEVSPAGLSEEGWTLTDSRSQALLLKLKSQGVPLSEYVDGKIFYGIKTGYNEAFVIDAETRERLIAEDPKSAEIIKPFLAGRDIKRYQQPKSDKFLILFPKGFTIKRNLPMDDPNYLPQVSEPPRYGYMGYDPAWAWVQHHYPAIAGYLRPFEKAAKKRSDQGDYWWELRACDYYDEFEKNKIMLPDISIKAEALLDTHQMYCVNTAYIIPKGDRYLLAILNSKLVHFFYSNLTSTIRGGYLRFIRQYLAQIPIAAISEGDRAEIENLVEQILESKKQDPSSDTSTLEAEIDQLVYGMYGLSEEEIGIVEKGS